MLKTTVLLSAIGLLTLCSCNSGNSSSPNDDSPSKSGTGTDKGGSPQPVVQQPTASPSPPAQPVDQPVAADSYFDAKSVYCTGMDGSEFIMSFPNISFGPETFLGQRPLQELGPVCLETKAKGQTDFTIYQAQINENGQPSPFAFQNGPGYALEVLQKNGEAIAYFIWEVDSGSSAGGEMNVNYHFGGENPTTMTCTLSSQPSSSCLIGPTIDRGGVSNPEISY